MAEAYFCRALARSPGLLSPFGKMSTEYRLSVAGVCHIELELRIRVYILRCVAVISDCTGARVENDTRPARRNRYTHTGIAYARLLAPNILTT